MKEQQTASLDNQKTHLEKKIKPRATFQGDFRKHTFLTTYICPNNDNQENENFEAFLDLILRESDTVKGIAIIDTRELYEKYYKKILPDFKVKYEQMIEKKLGKGKTATVQWKIINWSERTSTAAYVEAMQHVQNDFKQDKYNLVTVVANNVKAYKKLNGEEAAIRYGLEELAEFATQKGAVVFPGKLNGILKWGLKHYKIPVNFIRYKFKQVSYNSENLSSDNSDDMEVLMPTPQASSTRFFPAVHECRQSPPDIVYSSSPEDDETALLLKTVGFYAVKAKERIKKQHNVDGYQAQLIFLQGYLDYCQRAGTNYQITDIKTTLITEDAYTDSNIIENKR